MKYSPHGKHTSAPDISTVTPTGFTLSIDGREIDVAFADFPFFRDVPLHALRNITRPLPEHLEWPSLGIELELESLEHPERFPLTERRLR